MWIIYHALEEEIRFKYLPILYEAAQKGELQMRAFTFFINRVHMIKFGTQLYGSQSQYNVETKGYERVPVEKEELLNQRFDNLDKGQIDLGRITF